MTRRIAFGTWAGSVGPYADDPVPFEECVRRIHELGYDGIELLSVAVHPNPDRQKTSEERAEVRNVWESRGMGCSSLAPDLWSEKLITAPDVNSYLAAFRKNLQFAADLGTKVIRVDTTEDPGVLGQVEGEPRQETIVDYDVALKRVCDTWKICAQEAAECGVLVVWEYEPGFAFNKPSDVFRVLDGVGHDNFLILFDICHTNMMVAHGSRQPGKKETLAGGIKEMAERLEGKIGRLHLIDSDGTLHDNHTSTHSPFGEGELNFDEFMPAVVAAGCPDDWWTVDLCFWPNAWEIAAECKKAVDEMVVKYT